MRDVDIPREKEVGSDASSLIQVLKVKLKRRLSNTVRRLVRKFRGLDGMGGFV